MPRVNLRGLHSSVKRLASGEKRTYWYAFRGGPRLPGEPGDPEFIAAYAEAIEEARNARYEDTLQSILNAYQNSTEFTDLAPRTRADYVNQIRKIEAKFGDLPIAALADRRCRGEFKLWRDRLAEDSRRQADYAFAVLARICAWALDRGLVTCNPCERAGRLYASTRAGSVWSDADVDAFMSKASEPLQIALMLALWTGQRQGDLLRLPWSAYDGERIQLRQGKTGAYVDLQVAAPLKRRLDATRRTSITILANGAGNTWTADGFRSSWAKACARAGIVGLTFHDLRGSTVTRLALAGATIPEIAAVTGHSLKTAGQMVDAYLRRDRALGDSAIAKLELQTASQTVAECSKEQPEKVQ